MQLFYEKIHLHNRTCILIIGIEELNSCVQTWNVQTIKNDFPLYSILSEKLTENRNSEGESEDRETDPLTLTLKIDNESYR
jgi:hypothetical protein